MATIKELSNCETLVLKQSQTIIQVGGLLTNSQLYSKDMEGQK